MNAVISVFIASHVSGEQNCDTIFSIYEREGVRSAVPTKLANRRKGE